MRKIEMDVEHSLLVSFPDQSEAYTLGFEAGMVWQRLQNGERCFDVTAHAENTECVRRMADYYELAFEEVATCFSQWVVLRLYEKEEGAKPKLRVIKDGRTDTLTHC